MSPSEGCLASMHLCKEARDARWRCGASRRDEESMPTGGMKRWEVLLGREGVLEGGRSRLDGTCVR